MIKEFKDELQAKAVAESLGLFMTKHRGVYIVGNNKEEILDSYNLGYNHKRNVFYDKKVFMTLNDGSMVVNDTFLVDASSIELPYNLKDCSRMFSGCRFLKIPPIIPKGVIKCAQMFKDCVSLETPPNFPENCYTIDALKGTPFANGSLNIFP